MKPEPDFYIGWQDKAPPVFAKPVRWFAIGLFVLIPALAGLLVWQQRGFSNAIFEYGRQTTIEGQLIRQPIPFLRMAVPGSTPEQPLFARVLLIGPGKHGAGPMLDQWEQKHGSLAHKNLTVSGTLIYDEGRAVLELTDGPNALLRVSQPARQPAAPVAVPLGRVALAGEITDPKCFLGVMKPGDGRPHRSCAVRCIAGGIPPMLYLNDGRGHRNGYLLVGANGEPINEQILADVGRRVQLNGRLEQADNWLILYTDAVQVAAQAPQPPDEQRAIAMCR